MGRLRKSRAGDKRTLEYNHKHYRINKAWAVIRASKSHAKKFGWVGLNCSKEFLALKYEEFNGHCDACGNPTKRPHTDHCHLTGDFRGLVCVRCNMMLHLLDSPELEHKLKTYLARSGDQGR